VRTELGLQTRLQLRFTLPAGRPTPETGLRLELVARCGYSSIDNLEERWKTGCVSTYERLRQLGTRSQIPEIWVMSRAQGKPCETAAVPPTVSGSSLCHMRTRVDQNAGNSEFWSLVSGFWTIRSREMPLAKAGKATDAAASQETCPPLS